MPSLNLFSLVIKSLLNFRKTLLLISLFLLFIPLIGCQNTENTFQETADQTEITQGQLLIWYAISNEDQILLDNFIKNYQDIYPNIKIIKEYIPQDEIVDRLINRVSAGLGPDLVLLWQPMLPTLIEKKVIQVIPKHLFDTSIYAPSTLLRVTNQKKMYALPISLHTTVLCYDQKQVPNQPESINELIEITNQGKRLGLQSNLHSLFWLLGLFGGDLQYMPNNQIKLSNPNAWVKWLELIRDLQVNPNVILNNQSDVLIKAFVEGKLALIDCSTTEIPYLHRKLGDRLQIALLPSVADNLASPLLFMRVAVFNREATASQTELGLKFIKFITNQDQQLLISSNLQSFIPTNQKVTIDPRLSPRSSLLLQQAKQSVAIPLTYQEKVNEFFIQLEPLYQQIKGSEITPAEAVKSIEKLLEKINNPTN